MRYLFLVLLTAQPAWACDVHERPYNTPATVGFCLWERDGTDFKVDAVLVPGDVKITKDEGPETNCATKDGACVGDEGSCYSVSLTASEMQAAAVQVNIIDAAPKAYLDKCLIIRTQD